GRLAGHGGARRGMSAPFGRRPRAARYARRGRPPPAQSRIGSSARPPDRPYGVADRAGPAGDHQGPPPTTTGTDSIVKEPAAFDRRVLVAIDGPSGSGKSTVARGVAARLGLRYLDTGAMYRALTWLAQRDGVAVDDAESLAKLASCWEFDISTDPDRPWVVANGVEVTTAIRSAEVTAAVSAVSAVPAVRVALVARQRAIVGQGGIVLEGRDTGTAVCPDAP